MIPHFVREIFFWETYKYDPQMGLAGLKFSVDLSALSLGATDVSLECVA